MVPPVPPLAVMVAELQNVPPPLTVTAVGSPAIVTEVVAFNAAHPPFAGIVYVTVYGPPAVEVDGVIAPDPLFKLNAPGPENEPPDVPVNMTDCGLVTDVQ